MSDLTELLKARIAAEGPISLHDYMELSLGHPEYGYYATRNPFGQDGDFITAPEISQMFGELIGLWCVDAWAKLGAPSCFNLVELGPGNGTLMADALRSAKLAPEFVAAAKIHLIENSARLKTVQTGKLTDHTITWHQQLPELAGAPLILIANEFFDALPIHQFQFRDGVWRERRVDWQNDRFLFTLEGSSASITGFPKMGAEADIYEYCPLADTLIQQISKDLSQNGGTALIIDYGATDTILGDSFQAMRAQGYVDPLLTPGEADLTAHVKFSRLTEIAKRHGIAVHGPTSQGRFLERLGIEARASLLGRVASETQKAEILSSLRRLTSAEEMGTLFKTLALSHNIQAPPEGFGE